MNELKSRVFPNGNSFKINSNPIFMITKKGEREILVFDASMNVKTSDAQKDIDGIRKVGVDVVNWQARATSKLLGCDIGFKITGLGDSSRVIAENLNQDFPAKLMFNMEYEIMINGEVVKSNLTGSAVGEITDFPPAANDMFQVSGKTINLGSDTSIDVIACAC